ncbi:rhodanese-like domain-containing protein [Xylophilus sp. GW821-FHT01B05]
MTPASIPQLRPSELDAWLAATGSPAPVVLDVREPWELQTASVQPAPGFRVVAVPMNEIPGRLAELDPATPVACLCHHGARSQRVAVFLAQQEFEQVANIAGGIDAWSIERDAAVPRY